VTEPDRDPREVARHTFRHPATGHAVTIAVAREPKFGEEPWWRVDVEDTLGSPPWMARLRGITLVATRAKARGAFAEKQRALRAGTWSWRAASHRPRRGDPRPRGPIQRAVFRRGKACTGRSAVPYSLQSR
jgi:hypothetical protein